MGNAMTTEAYIKNIFSTYSLVTVLSRKNDSQVLRIRNKSNGQDLVLRCLPGRNVAYEILCDVRCRNVPEIYDVLNLEDGQIILEEYISGLTVSEVMKTGKYRYHGAKKVLLEVCQGLSALHSLGIIHRDVKPENVIVENSGRVVLIDFHASRKESVATKDTVVMGTVGYASPEQLGLAQTDARTDIYGAGVLLNMMMTGNFPTESFASGRAGKIVRKCTALNPNERYQTAEKLWKAL